MRRMKFIAVAVLAVVMSVPAMSQTDGGKPVEVVCEGIRFCESTYPYDGGVLIANFGTEQLNPLNTEGKGYILHYKNGQTRTLIAADGYLNAPKGMFLRDHYLYVCDVNKILVYDLKQVGKTPITINLPEGHLFVNDLAANGNDLYASVTNTDQIFNIDITDPAHPGAAQEWATVPGPNGLLMGENVLYVASYPADGQTGEQHVIYRIDNLKDPEPVKLVTVTGQYDGIAFSSDRKSLYVTNWAPAGLTRIDLKTGNMTPVAVTLEQGLSGPADITVSGGKIYIPDLPASRVVVVEE